MDKIPLTEAIAFHILSEYLFTSLTLRAGNARGIYRPLTKKIMDASMKDGLLKVCGGFRLSLTEFIDHTRFTWII